MNTNIILLGNTYFVNSKYKAVVHAEYIGHKNIFLKKCFFSQLCGGATEHIIWHDLIVSVWFTHKSNRHVCSYT